MAISFYERWVGVATALSNSIDIIINISNCLAEPSRAVVVRN